MPSENVAYALERALPHLRSYTRALTGDQDAGDCMVEHALKQLVANPKLIAEFETPKTALFHACHSAWINSGARIDGTETTLEVTAQIRLAGITRDARAVLLLTSLERFSTREVASIIGVGPASVDELLHTAHIDWRG